MAPHGSRHCGRHDCRLGTERRPRDSRGERSCTHGLVRRRTHAPGVNQAVGRRVRPDCAPSRHDCGRRGPARDRECVRSARRCCPGGGVGSPSVHIRDMCLQLRPGFALREPRSRARQWRAPRASRRARGNRYSRGDELPGSRQRRPRGARQNRDSRVPASGRPRPRALRSPARCLPRRWCRVRPRVHRAGRGRREAAQGNVDLHPGGFRLP